MAHYLQPPGYSALSYELRQPPEVLASSDL
jgi:hypothetical protein